ncbi:ATP-dependent DNA helicase RecG [Lignipirellula cremea]|uniref:ATP-dependent DNA helicase RecG n=1 Tax=Lignipirellula cremea TaxID=2528010 RepID=A0A518E335_9BACT|nr:ATP-dependent DNA helicase RecG [Lignipirellula cremea]QDU98499.1 ATP-dependent DNA helicase RecG [Lignipirellula cremea]
MSQAPQKTPAEMLATPVQYVKGVGPSKAEPLARLKLRTARDLLFFFPRDYQDMSELKAIADLQEGETVSVCGTVAEVDLRNTGPGRSLLAVLLQQDEHFLRALWFNQPFMRQKFETGRRVLLSGTVKISGGRWELVHPTVELLGDNEEPPSGRVLPVYPLTEGINQGAMRRVVLAAVEEYSQYLDEVFPQDFLDAQGLWPIHAALPQLHAPTHADSLEPARRRFIFQELLVLQLALAIRRYKLTHDRKASPLPVTAKIDARIRRLFSFKFTDDQNRAIEEVSRDMAREIPMNRLLQGDVGSGKTVVALYAMLNAVAQGKQAALMAPTEVLARQHARTLSDSLASSEVRVALLTGSLTIAQRRRLEEQITANEIDLIVGTHAVANMMAQDDVPLSNLGLVIIDEQHKFGVKQRAALKQGGLDPHYLVMTATPIPRTISMTLFGDLDVSSLREKPPGRQPVHTYLADDSKRAAWWEFVRKKLGEGRQAYVVTPLVEETENWSLASVEQTFETLANGELADYRLDLVHGRLTSEEKETAMESFRQRRTQVLVATSVIEVGVDIPNATLMTIESGERFGLAQLHQLRGRISRGKHPGYLTVFASPQTDDSQARLAAFEQTNDGFELAEIDFNLRGPGDLFGARQHGLPPLRIADLHRDEEILQEARRVAQALIAEDPHLDHERWALLKKMVLVRYGKVLDLVDVG